MRVCDEDVKTSTKPRYSILLVRSDLEARINIVLRNRECVAVTDSGAQISIISSALADGLELQPCNLRLIDVNGKEVSVRGQTELELCIGSEAMVHLFVVADIANTVLLGFDFLARFNCILDFERMQLRVGHSTVGFSAGCHRSDKLSRRIDFARRGVVPYQPGERAPKRPIPVRETMRSVE